MMYLQYIIGKRKSINRKKFSERSLSPGRGEYPKEKFDPDLARRQSESGEELKSDPKKERARNEQGVKTPFEQGSIRKRARYVFLSQTRRKIKVRSLKIGRIERGREPNRV
jgi:hypothetical protein